MKTDEYNKIRDLSDQGASAQDIAEISGLPLRQIKKVCANSTSFRYPDWSAGLEERLYRALQTMGLVRAFTSKEEVFAHFKSDMPMPGIGKRSLEVLAVWLGLEVEKKDDSARIGRAISLLESRGYVVTGPSRS